MPPPLIVDLRSAKDLSSIGPKARHLHWLIVHGFQVPPTYVCTYDLHSLLRQNQAAAEDRLLADLKLVLDPHKRYAVRSAARIEDAADFSFAGQFTTVLDVQGPAAVLETIKAIHTSASSAAAQSYIDRVGAAPGEPEMSVIVQEMIRPVASGVAFSKNPLTGFDELIIEAVEGSSEGLLQGGVTPDRWVYKWGEWITVPEKPAVAQHIADQVVAVLTQIARAYGKPVDVEWAFDGAELHWLQLREITGLSGINVYSNRISREVFPGIIKPLVWTVNVPLVNSVWIDLFTQLIGPNTLKPYDLARLIHYRAYFNMGAIGEVFTRLGLPRETLELLMGVEGGPEKPSFRPTSRTYTYLPRMVGFLLGKLAFARTVSRFLDGIPAALSSFNPDGAGQLDAPALLAEIDRLYPVVRQIAYFNVLVPLFMQFFAGMLRGQLARKGIDYAQVDLLRDMPELDNFAPSRHLERLHARFAALDTAQRQHVLEAGYAALGQDADTEALRQGLEAFAARFGHLRDSGNDFSSRPWREDRDLLLNMVCNHAPPAQAGRSLGWGELPLSRLDRAWLSPLFRRARQFMVFREKVSFYYTLMYGWFREYFLAAGDRFVARGLLDAREDIFYLEMDEVRAAVEGSPAAAYPQLVAERRSALASVQDVVLPDIVIGDEVPPLQTFDLSAKRLQGVPASRGYYTGPVRVIQSVAQFNKLEAGDVLIIPYSDVSWTPLFARAGAVVAESGGLLSHSSIVAREYGLPAVVSVNGACRIPDSTVVTVDGFKGQIIFHKDHT
jgi:pyruvate,water dikinase